MPVPSDDAGQGPALATLSEKGTPNVLRADIFVISRGLEASMMNLALSVCQIRVVGSNSCVFDCEPFSTPGHVH